MECHILIDTKDAAYIYVGCRGVMLSYNKDGMDSVEIEEFWHNNEDAQELDKLIMQLDEKARMIYKTYWCIKGEPILYYDPRVQEYVKFDNIIEASKVSPFARDVYNYFIKGAASC